MCSCLELSKLTLSHFENRLDVTVYFILGKTELCALLSVHGKIPLGLSKWDKVYSIVARLWKFAMKHFKTHLIYIHLIINRIENI